VRLNYFGCVSNDEPVVTVLADREVGALVSRQLPWENHSVWRNTCLGATLPTRSLMWTTWASMVISWPLTA